MDEAEKDARIAQLEAELDEARAVVIDCNNSLFGSHGYFVSEQAAAIENLKRYGNEQWKLAQASGARLALAARAESELREQVRRWLDRTQELLSTAVTAYDGENSSSSASPDMTPPSGASDSAEGN